MQTGNWQWEVNIDHLRTDAFLQPEVELEKSQREILVDQEALVYDGLLRFALEKIIALVTCVVFGEVGVADNSIKLIVDFA